MIQNVKLVKRSTDLPSQNLKADNSNQKEEDRLRLGFGMKKIDLFEKLSRGKQAGLMGGPILEVFIKPNS